jgi:hypothetical protein
MYKYTSELGADKLDTGLWCVLQPEKRENQNYGNIFKIRNCGTYFSELWELIKKNRNYGNISIFRQFGIVGTYTIGIVALVIRNYGILPLRHVSNFQMNGRWHGGEMRNGFNL